ncbi:hypothetical protein UFOVP207_54 [uncultured Caudovirales phage]|uniref:Uncharacterized protein n=1 Tax=uncultured Caudovirales phage TaxID=2100421 RepID=A0A6J7WN02_9CAUD|nr:hypothetical protein UFOVP207_54 [uncultured Caudovirales phage]
MLNVQEELDKFKKYVIQQSKSNLSKQDRNVSSKLYNSIKGEAKAMPNSFYINFEMEPYGQFLDQGIKGKNSSSKAPNSPFKFGSGKGKKGGLTQGIDRWVRARRFQFRDKKKGKFLSYESTAFLITRSIYSKGTKPTLFFTKPFNKYFEKLPEELIVKYGLDASELFNYTIQQPK